MLSEILASMGKHVGLGGAPACLAEESLSIYLPSAVNSTPSPLNPSTHEPAPFLMREAHREIYKHKTEPLSAQQLVNCVQNPRTELGAGLGYEGLTWRDTG